MNALRRLLRKGPSKGPLDPPRASAAGQSPSALTRALKFATLFGLVSVLWACNAPFIPVPPPGASFTSELVDDGAGGQKTVWITHGLPSTNAAFARYSIFDVNTGSGVISTAGADGTFTSAPMDGTVNDHIQLYYQTPGGDYSESICLLLTTDVGAGGSAPACPP